VTSRWKLGLTEEAIGCHVESVGERDECDDPDIDAPALGTLNLSKIKLSLFSKSCLSPPPPFAE
jgi:hypothetical protein